jgi:hypothetical protein
MDLIALWDLPATAFDGASVKVQRKEYGSETQILITEVSPRDYSMEMIAREYGPGRYTLMLSPAANRSWGIRHCQVNISPDYATRAGYNMIPPKPPEPAPIRISDMRAAQETSQMLQGTKTFGPGEVAALIESVAERTALAMRALPQVQPPSPQPQNGFAGMESMFGMLKMLTDFQNSAVTNAMQWASGKLPVEAEEEDTSWSGVLKQCLPALATGLQTILAPRSDAPMQQTGQFMQQNGDSVRQEDPVQIPLTEEEAKGFAGAIRMLSPFVGGILSAMAKLPPEEAAKGMEDYIPGPLVEQLIGLSALAQERGPNVLALLDKRLATPEGVRLIVAVSKALAEPGEEA